MSATSVTETARQVCAQIKALKAVHRNGLTPTFGQVEELFDRAEELERSLATVPGERPPRLCTRPTCGHAATTMVGTLPYCGTCGSAVRNSLKALESFGLNGPVSVLWPAADTGAHTGIDPRD